MYKISRTYCDNMSLRLDFSKIGIMYVFVIYKYTQWIIWCFAFAAKGYKHWINQGLSKEVHECLGFGWCDNDPSAGSPTETLLRLHLPLNDKVRTSSRGQAPIKEPNHNPESSPDHSIGRCDGRCVQRAGT